MFRFSRGEYWLLDAVVEARLPLPMLDSADLGECLNWQAHGLPRDEIADALVQLSTAGLIAFRRSGGDIVLSRSEIICAMEEEGGHPQTDVVFGLTSAGGCAWESFASPKWSDFVSDLRDNSAAEVTAADTVRLRRYVEGLHYVGIHVVLSTIVWDEVSPWEPTYWKTLLKGYRARFAYSQVEVRWDDVPLSYYYLYENRWYRWH